MRIMSSYLALSLAIPAPTSTMSVCGREGGHVIYLGDPRGTPAGEEIYGNLIWGSATEYHISRSRKEDALSLSRFAHAIPPSLQCYCPPFIYGITPSILGSRARGRGRRRGSTQSLLTLTPPLSFPSSPSQSVPVGFEKNFDPHRS